MTTIKQRICQELVRMGHADIRDALEEGTTPFLDQHQKRILRLTSEAIQAECAFPIRRLRRSLVENTTSGWSREPETSVSGSFLRNFV